jgi:hypothetical protein
MLLFLLTAREGRVSANRFGCSVIAQFPDAGPCSHTFRAAAFVRLPLSPGGIPNDKTGNIAGVLFRH